MDDRPDLLLGIIVTHVPKQQQQHGAAGGKGAAGKAWVYSSERQERVVAESPVSVQTTHTTSVTTPTTVIRETETIASPGYQVADFAFHV